MQSYVTVNGECLLPEEIETYGYLLTYKEADILKFTITDEAAKQMSDYWLEADSRKKVAYAVFNEDSSFMFPSEFHNKGAFPNKQKHGVAPGEYTMIVMFYNATDLEQNHHDVFLFIQISPDEDVETDHNTNGWCYKPFIQFGNNFDPTTEINTFYSTLFNSLLGTKITMEKVK